VNAIEVLPPATAVPVAEQRALDLIDLVSTWKAHPSKVKLLIERARTRTATDKAIAATLGLGPNAIGHHCRKDETFHYLWNQVKYDEETAVLLLAYLTTRGAYATIYDAVNGGRPMRANVMAAQSVIELAERRRRAATGPNPMLKALEEAIG